MDTSQLLPHLNYMTDAAHLLQASSPQTSGYLMSRRNELLLQHGAAQSDVQKQHVCNACGHILIPGRHDTLQLKTVKAPNRKRTQKNDPPRPKNMRSAVTKIFTCAACDAVTRISVSPPPRSTRKAPPAAAALGLPEKAVPNEPTQRSVNASSKKRAKSRKAGLQALLSKSQAPDSLESRSLTLADFGFMKK